MLMTITLALKDLRHWLAHLTHWNACQAISWYDTQGNYYTGARCITCHEIDAATVVNWNELQKYRR